MSYKITNFTEIDMGDLWDRYYDLDAFKNELPFDVESVDEGSGHIFLIVKTDMWSVDKIEILKDSWNAFSTKIKEKDEKQRLEKIETVGKLIDSGLPELKTQDIPSKELANTIQLCWNDGVNDANISEAEDGLCSLMDAMDLVEVLNAYINNESKSFSLDTAVRDMIPDVIYDFHRF